MRLRLLLAALGLFAASCVFRQDLDGGRNVHIRRTAPPQNALTGQRTRFGMIVEDSDERTWQLGIYAQLDGGETLSCAPAKRRLTTIDRTETGVTFWCPLDPLAIESGKHEIKYWVVNRDGRIASQSTVRFTHDPIGPALTASVTRVSGGVEVSWSVEDANFAELVVQGDGMRLMSSFSAAGQVVLAYAIVSHLARLEARAVDAQKNEDVRVLDIPR